MPQLDIVFISLTYVWAWSTLILLTMKIKTIHMNKNSENPLQKETPTSTWNLPWM